MVWFRVIRCAVLGMAAGWVLSACQTQPVQRTVAQAESSEPKRNVGADRISLDLPEAWGGEVRCGSQGCLLGAVEHEKNTVVLHKLERDRTSRLLSTFPVLYHPDSAAWMSDDLLVAAVEDSAGVDIFRLVEGKLVKLQTVGVGYGPRDVVVVQSSGGRYRLLVTPYIGREVVWIDWQDGSPESTTIRRTSWCKSPWHPAKVNKLPQMVGGGVAVACLDDRRVVAVSDENPMAAPKVLATFSAVPRQVRPSPSGRWLYVALETGGRNARIDMQTGELQWIAGTPNGSASIALLSDDLALWGEDGRIRLQRLDVQGNVQENKELATSGFSTSLQLLDVDGDQHLDAVVLNSSGKKADVIYGPLWQKASSRP